MSDKKNWKHLQISFLEIKDATNDFKNCIGRGGYGAVYEGELSINGENTKVAVKRLNEKDGQGLKEFLTEIDLLSGQQHKNIISLVGYCDEGNEKIIVYEYAERGSLDRYIRCSDTSITLSWLERLKIVVDAACGLDHLHNHFGDHQFIIHRDIKCSNILLDEKWVAKVSDLGLSRLSFTGFGKSTVISNACGTQSYVEPEYIRSGSASKKSDVYSFGMVLFEVLCGRLSYVRDADNILLLAEVAKEYYVQGKLDRIIDPKLRKQMTLDTLIKYSAIAYKCLLAREERPLIDVVKKELEETLKLQMNHEKMERIKSLSISCEEDIVDDEYWMKKLPNCYQRYIQRSDDTLQYTNKRELYLRLCDGFLCDDAQLFFSLWKSNGKICSMLPTTRILCDDILYERLYTLSLSESRFREVKILEHASSYDFTCRLHLLMISRHQIYACYLVFKFEDRHKQHDDNQMFIAEYGLGRRLLGKVLVHMNVSRNKPTMKPNQEYDLENWMEERQDGWMEVMLAKPLEKLEDQSTLKVRLSLLGGSFGGIIVEGIEFRPYT